MKISFDFDKTLTRPDIQQLASKYINEGEDVWIVTRRYSDESDYVYEIADKLGIERNKVVFTNGEWKWRTIKSMDIDIHYDDKLIEVLLIERRTQTKAILV